LEFRSKLEDLMVAEELLFEPTPAFGEYKPFLEHAVAHPAKANTRLLEFLVERFTKAGDVILDPMAGSGSTGVVAALHGRNAVQVELEKKFYEWMEKAREKVEKHPTLISKGWIKNICGDARRLSELLTQVEFEPTAVITSPPYETQHQGGLDPNPVGTCIKERYPSKNNIANLPLGEISASPPYAETYSAGKAGKAIRTGETKIHEEKHLARPYTENLNKENIGNLPLGEISAIITSPPYERQLHDSAEKRAAGAWNGSELDVQKNLPMGYSENPENIGNLKRETYLEAMLRVYGEMWKVLKPGGLAIIIVKPFIRNKKVVDLPWHTWLLMAKVGFTLEKLYKLRLRTASFWRILYYKKYPNVPKINHEYVLICKKPMQNVG